MKTRVVKIKRKGNVVVQDCDVYIGRRCTLGGWNLERSKWANPFIIDEHTSRDQVLKKYKSHILSQKHLLDSLHELQGKTLGCWCVNSNSFDHPVCHGQILMELIFKNSQ